MNFFWNNTILKIYWTSTVYWLFVDHSKVGNFEWVDLTTSVACWNINTIRSMVTGFTSWPYLSVQGHRTEWRPDVFKGLACVFECHGNAPLVDSCCTTNRDRPSGPLSAQCAPHAALSKALIHNQARHLSS